MQIAVVVALVCIIESQFEHSDIQSHNPCRLNQHTAAATAKLYMLYNV